MMRELKIELQIGIFCTLIVIITSFITSCGSSVSVLIDTTGFVPNTNRNMAQVGDVRLVYDDAVLYETGVHQLFAKKRVALSGKGKNDSYASAFLKMENAYVTDAFVLYYKSHDYQRDLYYKERDTGIVVCVAEDVEEFLQINDKSVYFCKKNRDHFNADTLWKYDLETKEQQSILEDIATFCVNDRLLYAISCPTSAIAIADEYINTIITYDLETMDVLFEEVIPLQFAALNIQVVGDYAVLWSLRGRIYIYNIPTQEGEYLAYPTDAGYGGIRIALNGYGDSLYASMEVDSFAAMDSLAVETNKLGTWRYNLQSKEWLKLSEKVYDAIYVFDTNAVYGVLGKAVYRMESDGTSERLLK